MQIIAPDAARIQDQIWQASPRLRPRYVRCHIVEESDKAQSNLLRDIVIAVIFAGFTYFV